MFDHGENKKTMKVRSEQVLRAVTIIKRTTHSISRHMQIVDCISCVPRGEEEAGQDVLSDLILLDQAISKHGPRPNRFI